ncbi:MAG: hypothetical protein J6U54_01670 [Clostridiales bacterium]|nr:hypothetical protein [Clostridiales bacterium]
MEIWISSIVSIVVAVLASSGLWTFLQKISDKKDAKTKLLLGLAHDRIMFLGMSYIERGHITQSEYENLHDYLYSPYKEMGGNGSATRIMQAVDRLEIRNM